MYAKPTRVFVFTSMISGPSSASSKVTRNSPAPSKNAGDLSKFLNSFILLAPCLHGPDARIEQPNQDVGGKVGDQHRDGDEQGTAGDDRVVVALNRGQDGHAEAGIAEDDLGDQRAAHH